MDSNVPTRRQLSFARTQDLRSKQHTLLKGRCHGVGAAGTFPHRYRAVRSFQPRGTVPHHTVLHHHIGYAGCSV